MTASVVLLVVVAIVLLLIGSFGVPAAIVLAAVSIALGLAGQVVTAELQNRREVATKLREQKSDVYETFIKFWLDFLLLPENRRQRETGQVDQDALITGMSAVSQPLMLWASNDVVRAYADFRRRLTNAEQSKIAASTPMDTMLMFEQLLYLMMEDMGHGFQGTRPGDLLSFFVNDFPAT